jgi:hypothetical protein
MPPIPRSQTRLAVLIDAENASARLIEPLLSEVAKYGTANVKRIYGDWTTPNLASWKNSLNKFAIQPIQQFRYTVGKNATDSALIIDAMDLLHSGNVEGFCIVSSDSDFTRLACRIRESGLYVYGFGEQKTPEPFVRACDRFIRMARRADDGRLSLPRVVNSTKNVLAEQMSRECYHSAARSGPGSASRCVRLGGSHFVRAGSARKTSPTDLRYFTSPLGEYHVFPQPSRPGELEIRRRGGSSTARRRGGMADTEDL